MTAPALFDGFGPVQETRARAGSSSAAGGHSGRYFVRSFKVELRDGVDPAGRGDLLNDPALVKSAVRAWAALLPADQEFTWALFLTARNRLLSIKTEYAGTVDRAVVEPRAILRDALLEGAVGLILCHNHPSGDPTPSREDREFTRRMASGAEAVGVRLLDHMVVGGESVLSFRESGLM